MSAQVACHKLRAELRALQLRCADLERENRRLQNLNAQHMRQYDDVCQRIQNLTAKLKAIPCPKD